MTKSEEAPNVTYNHDDMYGGMSGGSATARRKRIDAMLRDGLQALLEKVGRVDDADEATDRTQAPTTALGKKGQAQAARPQSGKKRPTIATQPTGLLAALKAVAGAADADEAYDLIGALRRLAGGDKRNVLVARADP